VLAGPLAFSFWKRTPFYKEWRPALYAICLTALFYLAWDFYFTRIGVWGFNPKYITGISFGGLPIEEILFFFCVPYACLFTYFCMDRWRSSGATWLDGNLQGVTAILFTTFLLLALLNLQRSYTFSAGALAAIILLAAVMKKNLPSAKTFYYSYLVLILPFLLMNGVLTGSGLEEPVVWYNNRENLALRFGSIPVEDFVYAFGLILGNVLLFERYRKPPHVG